MSMTVNEIIERLQEMVEADETVGERDILIAYQPSYPLQVHLAGTYHPQEDNGDEYCMVRADEECNRCGKAVGNGDDQIRVLTWVVGEEGEGFLHDECRKEALAEDSDNAVIYLVASESSGDYSPYASRQIWSDR